MTPSKKNLLNTIQFLLEVVLNRPDVTGDQVTFLIASTFKKFNISAVRPSLI